MNPSSIHLTVATILSRDEKFLFVEEKCAGKLVINQPAGHVENNESLIDAAIRETLEETAWHIKIDGLIAFYRWTHPVSQETFFRACFAATALQHEPERKLDDGIVRSLWLSVEDLAQYADRLRSPLVMQGVKDYLSQQLYPLDLIKDLQD